MAPVKFDDIAKTATEVLNDDYQVSGVQFKAKQKTSWGGAVLTTAVDILPKGDCLTPAKLTWKLPTPLGCPAFCVDKLELDKSGGGKIEASTEKAYPGLKIECKSDIKSTFVPSVLVGFTYSGVKDTLVKLESKLNPKDGASLELSRIVGPTTLGAKCKLSPLTQPDLSVRFTQGPLFTSLMVKEKFGNYQAHCAYKACSVVHCAATYSYGGKTTGNFSLGVAYAVQAGTLIKAKVQQDKSLNCSVKHQLAKGFTLLAGGKYNTTKGDYTYGLQVSIE